MGCHARLWLEEFACSHVHKRGMEVHCEMNILVSCASVLPDGSQMCRRSLTNCSANLELLCTPNQMCPPPGTKHHAISDHQPIAPPQHFACILYMGRDANTTVLKAHDECRHHCVQLTTSHWLRDELKFCNTRQRLFFTMLTHAPPVAITLLLKKILGVVIGFSMDSTTHDTWQTL